MIDPYIFQLTKTKYDNKIAVSCINFYVGLMFFVIKGICILLKYNKNLRKQKICIC